MLGNVGKLEEAPEGHCVTTKVKRILQINHKNAKHRINNPIRDEE